MKRFRNLLYIALAALLPGCGDGFLDIEPTSSLGEGQVVENVQDLEYAVNGAYTYLEYYRGSTLLEADLMAEDLMCCPGKTALDYVYQYLNNKYNAPTGRWSGLYTSSYHINSVLKKAESIHERTDRYKELIAELRFIRAIIHFDVNVRYGPFPGNLGAGGFSKDALGVRITKELPDDLRKKFYRDKVTDVYDFIITEMEQIVNDLPRQRRNAYLTYWAGKAFMARVYLYHEDWDKALACAEDVIENSPFELLERDKYLDSWKTTYSSEAIFEMPTTDADNGGWYTLGYYSNSNGYKHIAATLDFLKLKDADPEDIRFGVLVRGANDDFWYPENKWYGRNGNMKVCNPKVYRLSECYLIAAEAALKKQQPDLQLAGKYLSDLRENRSLTNPRKYDNGNITLDDILYERRVELFAEGHRAFDLWRNRRDVVRWTDAADKEAKRHWSPQRVVEWNSHLTLWPIANRELEFLDPAEQEQQQNPGY